MLNLRNLTKNVIPILLDRIKKFGGVSKSMLKKTIWLLIK